MSTRVAAVGTTAPDTTAPGTASGGTPPGWRDRLLASDPGNVRLALATRAAASLAAALAVADLLAGALGLAGTAAVVVLVLGAVLTMITTFTTADPTPAGRAITMVCLPVAMLAGITLSTLVDRHRVLSLTLFVAVMFVVVWIRRFGPRAFAAGMVAWMGYFIALFLQLSFDRLPVVAAAVGTTTVLLLLIALVIAPARPARRLRRMVDSFGARVRLARAEHDDPARRPAWFRPPAGTTYADRALLRVNETAVLVDGQLAIPGSLPDPAGAAAVREAVLRVEDLLARRLDAPGGRDDAAALDARLDGALAALTSVLDDDRTSSGAVEVPPPGTGRAVFAPGVELFAGFLPGSVVTVGPMVAPEDDGERRMALTTRQAWQIALAGGLSIALGDALSAQRWYWAVLACFLAFTGTATAAETVRKAAQRTVGTVVGVLVALVVVPLLGSTPAVSLGVILLAIFVGFYLFRVSYTALAFAVTIIVAELYAMLGTYTPGLLALRVGETALGALIGGVVAVSFLPASASSAERAARGQLAGELRAATREVAVLVRGGPAPGDPAPDLAGRARALDAAVHQLALVGVPLALRSAPGGTARRAELARRLARWVRCAVAVRALVLAAEVRERTGRRDPRRRHERVGEAMAAVTGLVDALADGRGPGEHATWRHGSADDPAQLLGELAALHGTLVALHEIDPTTAVPTAGETDPGDRTTASSSGPRPPAGARQVLGRVTDGEGRAVDAVVTVVDGAGRQRGHVRAGAGTFAVPVTAGGGPWQVVVAAAGFAPHAGWVTAPSGLGSAEVRCHVVLRPVRPAGAAARRGVG